ncbi:MOT10 protein, partial [Polyodon spathula]|nr:MOT10 protein [Polyodon spathula]
MNFFQRVPFRRFSTEERVSEPHSPEVQKSPPDGGWGWVVVLSSFIFNVLVLGFHNSFGVYLISFLETFRETSSKIGKAWVGSISYGLIMIFGPVSGKMTEKFGARIVSILGSILIIVSIVGSSYASKLDFLFLTHGVVTGIGSSFAFTPGMIMISQYFTTQRSFATGIVMSGGAAGALVQTRLHQYLIRTVGWRQSMRIFAGIMGISVVAGFAYKPLNPPGHSRSVVENLSTSPIKGFIIDLGLWKDRVFLIWVFANGLAKFGFFIPYVHLINHGVQLGIPFELAANIMLVLGMSSFISRIIFGRICNSSRINRLYINQGSVFTVGLLYMLIPFFKTFGSLVAFGLFLGIADAGNYILLPVLTFDLMGAERMAVAWGFMLTVNSISCYGPPFAGWMNDMYGSYNLGFIAAGALNVASVFVLALIPWAKRSSMQNRKSILSVSINETTHEIKPWLDNNATEVIIF